MENPSTGVKVKIGQDIWGHYYFNDEVIYSDFSVYNKKTNQLTLANGTVYDGKTEGNIITFGNNDAVIKGSFEKGKKIINGVVLDNDTVVTASGVIQYPNGITYTAGVGASLPNNEIINESFLDKDYIDLKLKIKNIIKRTYVAFSLRLILSLIRNNGSKTSVKIPV